MSHAGLAFAVGLVLTLGSMQPVAYGQELMMPGEIGSSSSGAASGNVTGQSGVTPAQQPFSVDSVIGEAGHSTMSSSGGYYNPILGAHIRARYSTQSYGQDRGNLDLGTMKVWDQGDSVSFFDGQVTLNEESHVGYNLGLGYRWMSLPLFPFSADDEKIMGLSLWADGQGAGGDNFFPQIGASFEMLGDRVDFRANGYLPVGPESKDRDFQATGDNFFTGNNIAEQLVGIRDTSLSVLEGELAGRISNYDAWVFGGVYGFTGGSNDEVGGKIGLRGYATPDLALSIALTNDALFDTNAVFSATWFIGRTRRENCPTGQLRDRFREPVIRNDYVALAQTSVLGAQNPLTDVNNELIRVVHIDSTAAAAGDGTFENPYATLAEANGTGSMEGDILLAHAGSNFVEDSVVLQDNQRLLGEGLVFDDGNALTTELNVDHTVTVFGGGTVSLPETETGAFATAAATITNTAAIDPTITLADNNEVNNLVITGGTRGIAGNALDPTGAGTNGSGDSNLQNLQISGTSGNAIELTMARRVDENDASLATLEMDVNLDNIELDNIGGAFGILIDAEDNGLATDASTTAVNESITINNVDFANSSDTSTAVGLQIQNTTNSTAITSINQYTYDGGATGLGGIAFESVDGTVNVTGATTFAGGGAAGTGVSVSNSPALITFADTVEINNVGGTGISVTGNTPNFIFNGSMTNNSGDAVSIANINGGLVDITFEGGLTDTGTGINVDDIGSATIVLDSSNATANTISSAADNAIEISNVTDAGARVTLENFEVNTTSGTGLVAGVTNTDGTMQLDDLSVTTTTGQGVDIDQSVANDDFQSIFNGLQVTTDSGTAISAVQGNLTVAAGTSLGENTITTNTGTALDLNGTSVNAGVNFDQVDVTNAATNAIQLSNVNDGPIAIGANTGTDGDGGTISATQSAVELTNVSDFTISDVIVAASGSPAFDVENTSADPASVTINNVQTPAGLATAVEVTQLGAGDQSVTIADSDFNNTTGDAVVIDGATGAVSVTNTNVDNSGARALVFADVEGDVSLNTISADNAVGDAVSFSSSTGTTTVNALTVDGGSARGVVVTNSNGNFTFDSASSITDQDGIALDVDGGSGTVTYNGTIENTVGNSISVTNKTGGGVNFAPSGTPNITDSGAGIIVADNTAGNYNFLGNHDLDTTTNTAVSVTNNTGSIVTFGDLDINTTSGSGFVATGGGTIGVNPNSTVTTTTGTGVEIDSMTVAGTGVTFDSVTVNGATNAVLLNELTGGDVSINGGTVTTTGDAISATNVATLNINGVTVDNAGANAVALVNDDASNMDVRIDNFTVTSATGDAINASHTGTGSFDLGLDDSDLEQSVVVTASGSGEFDLFVNRTDITTLGTDIGFDLELSGALSSADISFNTLTVESATADAFAFDSSGSAKDVRFSMLNGSLTNASNTATDRAFDGNITGSTSLEATLLSNSYNNTGTGDTFLLLADGAGANIDLNMVGDSVGSGSLTLNESNGANFRIVDVANVEASNNNDIDFTPNVLADFDDITAGDVAAPND